MSVLSSGTPSQKTAERTSIEMATDGANDVVQVSVVFRLLHLGRSESYAPAQKTADRTGIEMATDGANYVIQVVCWV